MIKKRKIMLILIALVTLCLAVSAVSAWEFSFGSSSSSSVSTDGDVATVEYKDGVLKINDKQFKIPNGYTQKENETQTGVNANLTGLDGAKISSATFTNGDKAIIVKYAYLTKGEIDKYTPASSDAQNQTINAHAGYLEKHTDGTACFTYMENGKLIQIEAPDEATINEILK